MYRFMMTAAVLALIAGSATPCRAQFSLGTASNYGVLVEPGAHSFMSSNGTITGNIGVGLGTAPFSFQNSSGTITDNVDFVNTTASISKPLGISGTVSYGVSAVTTAINTVNSLSAAYNAVTNPTGVGGSVGATLSITGSGQMISANSGTLINGNEVFLVASNKFNNNSGGITISGTSSQYVAAVQT